MKEVIRSSAFETNSSSSHSMVIVGGNFVKETLSVNSHGEVDIYGGEFGWGVEEHSDAGTKAAYCLSYLMMNQDVEKIESKSFKSSDENWKNFQWDFFTGNEKDLALLVESIHEATGCDVRFVKESGWDGFGYIDHQSDYVGKEAFESKENLIAFIFNKKSTLCINGDG